MTTGKYAQTVKEFAESDAEGMAVDLDYFEDDYPIVAQRFREATNGTSIEVIAKRGQVFLAKLSD
jgi:hypothetical protein